MSSVGTAMHVLHAWRILMSYVAITYNFNTAVVLLIYLVCFPTRTYFQQSLCQLLSVIFFNIMMCVHHIQCRFLEIQSIT